LFLLMFILIQIKISIDLAASGTLILIKLSIDLVACTYAPMVMVSSLEEEIHDYCLIHVPFDCWVLKSRIKMAYGNGFFIRKFKFLMAVAFFILANACREELL